jgi:hypothetical protein
MAQEKKEKDKWLEAVTRMIDLTKQHFRRFVATRPS